MTALRKQREQRGLYIPFFLYLIRWDLSIFCRHSDWRYMKESGCRNIPGRGEGLEESTNWLLIGQPIPTSTPCWGIRMKEVREMNPFPFGRKGSEITRGRLQVTSCNLYIPPLWRVFPFQQMREHTQQVCYEFSNLLKVTQPIRGKSHRQKCHCQNSRFLV